MNKQKYLSKCIVFLTLGLLGISASASFASHIHSASAMGICAGEFNSQFTSNANCWDIEKGTWEVKNGKYQIGFTGYGYSSVSHRAKYTKMKYIAKMKRIGTCSNCLNYLMIRGTPDPLVGAESSWQKAYGFAYDNEGRFRATKINSGTWTGFIESTSTAINKGGWNILKVVARRKNFKFFINNVLVWSGSDNSGSVFKGGKVGIMTWSQGELDTKFLVDWAKIIIP